MTYKCSVLILQW